MDAVKFVDAVVVVAVAAETGIAVAAAVDHDEAQLVLVLHHNWLQAKQMLHKDECLLRFLQKSHY